MIGFKDWFCTDFSSRSHGNLFSQYFLQKAQFYSALGALESNLLSFASSHQVLFGWLILCKVLLWLTDYCVCLAHHMQFSSICSDMRSCCCYYLAGCHSPNCHYCSPSKHQHLMAVDHLLMLMILHLREDRWMFLGSSARLFSLSLI